MKPSQGTWWSSKAVTTCFLYTDTIEKKGYPKTMRCATSCACQYSSGLSYVRVNQAQHSRTNKHSKKMTNRDPAVDCWMFLTFGRSLSEGSAAVCIDSLSRFRERKPAVVVMARAARSWFAFSKKQNMKNNARCTFYFSSARLGYSM